MILYKKIYSKIKKAPSFQKGLDYYQINGGETGTRTPTPFGFTGFQVSLDEFYMVLHNIIISAIIGFMGYFIVFNYHYILVDISFFVRTILGKF